MAGGVLERTGKRLRVLAVASGGGHWTQLLRLRPAFEGHDVTYVTVREGYRSQVAGSPFHCIRDATRHDKAALLQVALQLAWILLRTRPDVVVSTGAAPGYVAIRLGKWLGCRTAWIDSIANAETVSMAGQLAQPHADLWLTQWPHLAREGGPRCFGAVL
jgi:UDP-N-acetylglucosamine:LPS N-acetylglucosamine transferase